MNLNEKLYWEIEDYSNQVTTLLKEGEKIYSQKLTKKQVEQKIGKKLSVCPANQNPHFIVGARVLSNGNKFLDNRKSLRGNTQRCYLLK